MSDQTQPVIDLNVIKTGAVAWIGSADSKATALLAVAGAMLAAVAFASSTSTTSPERLLILFFCLTTIASIGASISVLLPRTDRQKILGIGDKPRLRCSFSYFGELSALDYDTFRKHVSNATQEDLREDASEQAFVVLRIAHQKMTRMRCSVILLSASLVLVAGFVFVRAFAIGAEQSGVGDVQKTQPNATQSKPLNPLGAGSDTNTTSGRLPSPSGSGNGTNTSSSKPPNPPGTGSSANTTSSKPPSPSGSGSGR